MTANKKLQSNINIDFNLSTAVPILRWKVKSLSLPQHYILETFLLTSLSYLCVYYTMINKELQGYRTYQRFLQILLTICGCWHMPTKTGKSRYYWSVCMVLITSTYVILNLHLSYIERHNLVNMMKSIGIVATAIGGAFKVTTFLINRESLINCHRTLNDLFEEELLRNEKIRTIMLSSLPRIRNLAYTYSAILAGLLLAYLIPIYLFIIRDLCHFRLTTNYALPVTRGRRGYFWTVPDNFLYHFHLVFETVSILQNILIACGVDGVFGFYIYQITSTINAMTFKLMNPLPTENFTDLLRTCVAKHQKLMQCRNTLEHIYQTIVLWHIVTNAVLLCALIYEATMFSEFDVANIMTFITYALVKLLQTFTYAWYGTVLTNAGDEFRKGIYFGEWPNTNLDGHVRTNVILTMMQKPMTVNAHFSPIDIVMFIKVLNTTISYFFLLQSIGDKE